jgi:carboxylate-amine ligase
MPLLEFTPSPRTTLGVELELQLIDPVTGDLVPAAPRVLERTQGNPKIKPELFRAMLEVNSSPRDTVGELRADLTQTLLDLLDICDEMGIEIASAGSHPFAKEVERVLYPNERYQHLLDRHRWVLRRFFVFGMHVHVGVRDGDHAAATINGILPYTPHLLALSASSPFWHARDTGLASSRITIFEALPTAGHPCTFTTWDEFVQVYQAMVRSRAIASIQDLWWDVRPHPDFGTVEFRICDAVPTLSEAMSLVALIQSLVARIDTEYRRNRTIEPPAYWILRENKWRASRWGLDAEIVLDRNGATRLLRSELSDLVDSLGPLARSLGCHEELAAIPAVAASGLSYERQRRVLADTGSFQAVTASLVEELSADIRGRAGAPRA